MITLLIWVVVLGIAAAVLSTIPMPAPFRTAAYGLLGLILLLIVLDVFGLWRFSPPLR